MRNGRREAIPAPVLCVGNFTVGGTGKTPVAIALARQAAKMGLRPGFLSRGHGGSFVEPHVVDAAHDSARHVGDEPRLLAEHAPVAVTPNRAAGARLLLERHGCELERVFAGQNSPQLHAALGELAEEAQSHADTASSLLSGTPPDMRAIFLPLALVRPALDRTLRAGVAPFVPQAASRLRVLWTLWRASRTTAFRA